MYNSNTIQTKSDHDMAHWNPNSLDNTKWPDILWQSILTTQPISKPVELYNQPNLKGFSQKCWKACQRGCQRLSKNTPINTQVVRCIIIFLTSFPVRRKLSFSVGSRVSSVENIRLQQLKYKFEVVHSTHKKNHNVMRLITVHKS